jgi:hypothetical protein
MAGNPTPPLVNWAYADWDSQSTDALRLARLKLHIQEVSGFMLETMSKGRSIRLSPDYMRLLTDRRDALESRSALQAIGSRAGRVSSFVRGTGP